MPNGLVKDQGVSLLVPAAALGHTSESARCAAARVVIASPPLRKREIIQAVALLEPAQATHLGPISVLAYRATMFGQYKVRVAIWPDQVVAVVAFDPRQARPRAEQLIRAYNTARAGARLAMEPSDTEDEDLPC